MTTIVTRAGKGSALTWDEGDANFTNLQTAIDDHVADTVGAHAGTAISNTPAGNIVATTVQAAINELDGQDTTLQTNITTVQTNLDTRTGTTSATGFRNRIINGSMRIDQRSAGSAVTVNSAANTYGVDRWMGYGQAADGVYTMQRSATTPPDGFSHHLRVTVTTADASIAAGQIYMLRHRIEGLNTVDLAFGTSSAKTITLSFRVRSSVTGTFGGVVTNAAQNRSYPFTFAVNSANTWETKTITIAGDTSGTWLYDTSTGIEITFDLGCGSTYKGTAGAWAGATYYGATGATNLIATLNATFDLTGVQLEAGTVATPFELRPISEELAMCQRYYWKWRPTAADSYFAAGLAYTTTQTFGVAHFPVPMRSAPAAVETSGTATDYRVLRQGTSVNCNVVPTFNQSSIETISLGFSVAAGLTAGEAIVQLCNSTSGTLGFSAEL